MIEQLWIFHCGIFRAPRSLFIKGESFGAIWMPFLAAVAHHSTLGPVLIDAPMGHDGPSNAGAVSGALLQAVSIKFKQGWSIIPRLEQLGYRASEVDHVLMTHLHFDHTGGMKELAGASFHLSKTDWDHIHTLTPTAALLEGYAVSDFRALRSRVSFLESSRRSFEPESMDPIDVFGDGSIEAIALPGHTRGQLGYRLQMADGRRAFYLGDAIYDVEQVTRDRMMGMLPRAFSADVPEAIHTVRGLRRYHAANPDDVLICSHDPSWGKLCRGGAVQI